MPGGIATSRRGLSCPGLAVHRHRRKPAFGPDQQQGRGGHAVSQPGAAACSGKAGGNWATQLKSLNCSHPHPTLHSAYHFQFDIGIHSILPVEMHQYIV